MANDPTRYQPARQQPPYQASPYDQTQPVSPLQAPPPPPYQQGPSFHQSQTPQGNKAGKSWFKDVIIGAVIIALMLLTIGGVAFFAARAHSASSVVNSYYSSVKQQDYSSAFTYVHFPAATGNQGFGLYKGVAQALDKTRGPVTSYSEQSSSAGSNGQTIVFENVQRNGSSYVVRLVLTKFTSEWKISSFTTI